MRYIFTLVIALGLLTTAPSIAKAEINVFACEPEWGALAKEIGGDHISVYNATKATQDVHFMRAKPSLLAAMRKADLVFCSGASLESGWLPILLQKAGSPNVQANTVGWLMASDHVRKLEVMQHADRSMGHVHPEGNPHVHLNPENMLILADMFADRLFQIDTGNISAYEANLERFKQRWQASLQKWKQEAETLRGKNVVVYHKSWSYLTDWTNMNVAASLEPKPGLPPTTSHLENVLQTLKNKKVDAILVAPFEDDEAAKWLAEKSGIKILRLPYTVGGSHNAQTLTGLFEETISMLKGTS